MPWTAVCQASPSFTISQSLPKFMSIESVLPSHHLILCHPLLLLPSIFPASESFPMSWLLTSSGQSFRTSASVLPESIQGWFPLRLTVLISSQSRELVRVFSSTTAWKYQFFGDSAFFIVQLSHNYWKDHSLNYTSFCQWSDVFASLTRCLHFYMPIPLFISLSVLVI